MFEVLSALLPAVASDHCVLSEAGPPHPRRHILLDGEIVVPKLRDEKVEGPSQGPKRGGTLVLVINPDAVVALHLPALRLVCDVQEVAPIVLLFAPIHAVTPLLLKDT